MWVVYSFVINITCTVYFSCQSLSYALLLTWWILRVWMYRGMILEDLMILLRKSWKRSSYPSDNENYFLVPVWYNHQKVREMWRETWSMCVGMCTYIHICAHTNTQKYMCIIWHEYQHTFFRLRVIVSIISFV